MVSMLIFPRKKKLTISLNLLKTWLTIERKGWLPSANKWLERAGKLLVYRQSLSNIFGVKYLSSLFYPSQHFAAWYIFATDGDNPAGVVVSLAAAVVQPRTAQTPCNGGSV